MKIRSRLVEFFFGKKFKTRFQQQHPFFSLPTRNVCVFFRIANWTAEKRGVCVTDISTRHFLSSKLLYDDDAFPSKGAWAWAW